jgi:hypothetical protein
VGAAAACGGRPHRVRRARRAGPSPRSPGRAAWAARARVIPARYVEHRGDPPSVRQELRVLAGCVYHVFRRRCGNGILLAAHSTGRVREALAGS